MDYTREWVPFGQAGTEKGISATKDLIAEARGIPEVHDISSDIVSHIDPSDHEGRLRAIFGHAQNTFRFVKDPWHTEFIKTPNAILRDLRKYGHVRGDCDDAVVYLGSLVESAGYPVKLSMLKADPARNDYSHIYLEAYTGKKWMPMDIISKKNKFGWEYPKHFGKRSDLVERSGVGMIDAGQDVSIRLSRGRLPIGRTLGPLYKPTWMGMRHYSVPTHQRTGTQWVVQDSRPMSLAASRAAHGMGLTMDDEDVRRVISGGATGLQPGYASMVVQVEPGTDMPQLLEESGATISATAAPGMFELRAPYGQIQTIMDQIKARSGVVSVSEGMITTEGQVPTSGPIARQKALPKMGKAAAIGAAGLVLWFLFR